MGSCSEQAETLNTDCVQDLTSAIQVGAGGLGPKKRVAGLLTGAAAALAAKPWLQAGRWLHAICVSPLLSPLLLTPRRPSLPPPFLHRTRKTLRAVPTP